jgi:hypothetical protein
MNFNSITKVQNIEWNVKFDVPENKESLLILVFI